ncbi:calpain family cysteine protease [Apiospora arundinis]|uniref:Calpain family cysteine protease n=1 Tax=Apiospora arundinis TaxID=335852 RepID=A0ABR2J4S3_9PEZI
MEGYGNQKSAKKTPQELIAAFWGRFHSKRPGKVTSIFPRSLYSNVMPSVHPRGAHSARNAAESYEAAASHCRQMVARIVRECRRTNEKYTDADFDIERDPEENCLNGLVRDGSDAPALPSAGDVKDCLRTLVQSQMLDNGSVRVNLNALEHFINSDDHAGGSSGAGGGMFSPREEYHPGSVHRLDWIFDSPQFTVNGYSSSDIKQGANGDCWWLAAVATIAHRRDLMERVCVARDEECGVYGFVFQRDGEWVSVVVDDNLYLATGDFDAYGDMYDSTGRRARLHRKRYQTGSEALYFARCEDPNETWLPLLEKAYAKTHGDYEAISGGWPGEAVEDMTGGVASTVASNRVLSKDKLWRELCNNDGEFVFALAAMGTGWDWQKSGLALGHAYSILQCRQETDEHGKVVRLVQIRNPWGERHWSGVGEWNGPWSDGAKEWTPYWLKKLNYTFGDDGVFWMSYKDMLETFMFIHRTRLFDERWTVVQQWTSANVSWITGYLQTKFEITVAKGGLVVIVLTQLDERYFRGFQGEYYFELHFLLQEVGAASGEHLCRVRPVHRWENRSVSCEVELEAGKRYEVLPKITATRNGEAKPPHDVVRAYAEKNPQKLRQVGMSYDLAHAKGGVPDEDELLEKRRAEQRKKREDAREKHRHERKKQKAIAKAARAVEKAAEAMKEIAKEEEEEEKEEEEKTEKGEDAINTPSTAKDTDEADEDKETWADAKSAPESQSQALEAPNGSEPKSANEVKNAPAPPAEEVKKEEEKADKHEEDSKKEEKEKKGEADDHGEEEEEEDDDDSDKESSDEDDDSEDGGEGPAMPPWNAVAVIGLRVYALDPEVTVELVKATSEDEVTTLTVDGKPAGATM